MPDLSTRKGRRLQFRHILFTAANSTTELWNRADEEGERRYWADLTADFQATDYYYGGLPEEGECPAETKMSPGEYRESLLNVLLGRADLGITELAQEMLIGKNKLKIEPRNLSRDLHTMCYPKGTARPKASASEWRDAAVKVIRKHLAEHDCIPADFDNIIAAVFFSGPPTHLPTV